MFGANGLVSRSTPGGGTVFYTFDERGNVAHRVNGSGAVTSTDLYDAFGKKRAGPADVVGFGGQAGYYTEAETGLVLCTNRFYDPQTGRFVTRDPIGYGGGVNLYGYTQNNPVNWMDPSGNGPKEFATGVMGTIAAFNYLGQQVVGPIIKGLTPRPNPGIERPFEPSPEDNTMHISEGGRPEAPEAPERPEDPVAEANDAADPGEGSTPRSLRPGAEDVEEFMKGLKPGAEGAGAGGAVVTGAGGGAVGAGPVAVIAAGGVAVADLIHYAITGKANGPFTSIGKWIGNRFFPGSYGLPAPPGGGRRKCH